MLKLRFHQDAGHGWIAVKRTLLIKLMIANKISSCSYQKGGTVYCEEDCDASELLDALTAHQIQHEIISKHVNHSPIRSYERYQEA